MVAWIILSAGTYPTPYAMLSVGYLTIALSIYGFFRGTDDEPTGADPRGVERWRRLLRAPWVLPWVAAVTIGAVALGLSFAKMVPTLSFLRQFPRVFNPIETHQAAEMFGGFWPKYGVVVVLAMIGVVTANLAAGIFFGGALLFFALALGDYGPTSPFHILKSLPIFGQLRFPTGSWSASCFSSRLRRPEASRASRTCCRPVTPRVGALSRLAQPYLRASGAALSTGTPLGGRRPRRIPGLSPRRSASR